MDIFLANKDSESVMSLVKKLSGEKKPGEIILLTEQEMEHFKNGDVVRITQPSEDKAPVQFVDLDPSKVYVAVADPRYIDLDALVGLQATVRHLHIIRSRID